MYVILVAYSWLQEKQFSLLFLKKIFHVKLRHKKKGQMAGTSLAVWGIEVCDRIGTGTCGHHLGR